MVCINPTGSVLPSELSVACLVTSDPTMTSPMSCSLRGDDLHDLGICFGHASAQPTHPIPTTIRADQLVLCMKRGAGIEWLKDRWRGRVGPLQNWRGLGGADDDVGRVVVWLRDVD